MTDSVNNPAQLWERVADLRASLSEWPEAVEAHLKALREWERQGKYGRAAMCARAAAAAADRWSEALELRTEVTQ